MKSIVPTRVRIRVYTYVRVRGHARGILVAVLLNSYYNSNAKF